MNILLLFHVFLLYFHALPPLFTPPLSLSPHLSHYLPSLPSSLHCPASDSQRDSGRGHCSSPTLMGALLCGEGTVDDETH